jgi:hypothetical protein
LIRKASLSFNYGKLTAQDGTAEAAVPQFAAPPGTHELDGPDVILDGPLVSLLEQLLVALVVALLDPLGSIGPLLEALPETEGELEPPVGFDEAEADEDVVVAKGVVVTVPLLHGVVGLALAQAQRELAAPRTAPIEAPQL